MHKITLKDGTVIKDLELNGNNYISKTEITESMFADNLETVIISDGNTEATQHNMKLVQISNMNGEYWFVLAAKSKEEVENDELRKRLADLTETVLLGGM